MLVPSFHVYQTPIRCQLLFQTFSVSDSLCPHGGPLDCSPWCHLVTINVVPRFGKRWLGPLGSWGSASSSGMESVILPLTHFAKSKTLILCSAFPLLPSG